MKKDGFKLYRIFVYLALILLAISIIIPLVWLLFASLKSELELVSGNPFDLPAQLLWQNYVDAFNKAKMGDYLLNTVTVTALALIILLVVALPASYVLARFKFLGKKFFNGLFMAGLFINVNYIVLPIYLMLFKADVALGFDFFLNKLELNHLNIPFKLQRRQCDVKNTSVLGQKKKD